MKSDTAGEIATRRKQRPLLRILVEVDRTRALFLSGLALRCELIFPHRFCPGEFASSIPTSSTSRRGGYSCGFDLRLDPIRLDHVGTFKRLSTEEHDLEDSQ